MLTVHLVLGLPTLIISRKFTDMITVTSGVAPPVATGTPLPQRLQTGSSTHLVANNFLALLAAVFGMTLA